MPRLPTAPGWYPDGMHPDEIRYWDGHDWTSQWRPRPMWAPSETQIIQLRPPHLGQRRHRARNRVGPAVFTAVLAAALLSSAVLAGRQGAGLGATDGIAVPIISDPHFVAAANTICARLLRPSGQAGPSSGAGSAAVISRSSSSQAAFGTAASLAARANLLAKVERGLGSVRIDPSDRAPVEQWLSNWGVAAAATAKEAKAVSQGTSAKAARSQASTAEAALDDFTETNAIDHCAV